MAGSEGGADESGLEKHVFREPAREVKNPEDLDVWTKSQVISITSV